MHESVRRGRRDSDRRQIGLQRNRSCWHGATAGDAKKAHDYGRLTNEGWCARRRKQDGTPWDVCWWTSARQCMSLMAEVAVHARESLLVVHPR